MRTLRVTKDGDREEKQDALWPPDIRWYSWYPDIKFLHVVVVRASSEPGVSTGRKNFRPGPARIQGWNRFFPSSLASCKKGNAFMKIQEFSRKRKPRADGFPMQKSAFQCAFGIQNRTETLTGTPKAANYAIFGQEPGNGISIHVSFGGNIMILCPSTLCDYAMEKWDDGFLEDQFKQGSLQKSPLLSSGFWRNSVKPVLPWKSYPCAYFAYRFWVIFLSIFL